MAIIEVEVIHFLTYNETLKTNPKYLFVSQRLSVTENEITKAKFQNIKQAFNFSQSIICKTTIKNLLVSNFLHLTQSESKNTILESLYQLFYAYQRILITPTGILNQNLNLTQYITVINTKGIIHLFNIIQTIGLKSTRNQLVTQSLLMNNNVIVLQPDPCCSSLINFTLNGPNSTGEDVH